MISQQLDSHASPIIGSCLERPVVPRRLVAVALLVVPCYTLYRLRQLPPEFSQEDCAGGGEALRHQ